MPSETSPFAWALQLVTKIKLKRYLGCVKYINFRPCFEWKFSPRPRFQGHDDRNRNNFFYLRTLTDILEGPTAPNGARKARNNGKFRRRKVFPYTHATFLQQLVFGGEKVKVKYANFDDEIGPPFTSTTSGDASYQAAAYQNQ